MSFQFNGLTAAVTISGSLSTNYPTMPSGATSFVKARWHTYAGAGAATFFTPAGGKKFYVTDVIIDSTVATFMKWGDNVTAAILVDTDYDRSVINGSSSVRLQYHFSTPFEIATAFNIYSAGACSIYLSIAGWEV